MASKKDGLKESMKINKKENYVLAPINPKIYPLDVIYSAAYVFLDKAYILLDGDPKKRVVIELKPKGEYDLEKLGREFNNELLNYAFYQKQSKKNSGIRQAILQRALLTSEVSKEAGQEIQKTQDVPDLRTIGVDYLADLKGIAVPWEEKYSKGKMKKKKIKKWGGKR